MEYDLVIKKGEFIHVHRNGLYVAKEEVRELEKLLREAKIRLNKEYDKHGGQSWYDYIYYLIFGY